MAAPSNAAPVIIKRKKVVQGGGHHGGAWKVAYADFVTAMMAFFLLMWLLNATTEKQRKGISDYFNPTIPVNRISGGGDGAFGGDSVFSEETLANTGTGATEIRTAATARSEAEAGSETEAQLAEVERALLARGGESNTMDQLLRHVVTRVTDEGLVIEIFDLHEIAVSGFLRAHPVTLIDNPVWDLSAERAQSWRLALEEAGLDPARMQRISGFADRKPSVSDPASVRNNRIEIVLLRRNR